MMPMTVTPRHQISLATMLLMKLTLIHGNLGSCFEKFPDFDVISGYNPGDSTSPNLITYGATNGDFIECQNKCKDDPSCYAYTQYFAVDVANSGICYGRGYGDNILVAVDSSLVTLSGVKIPCRYNAYIEIFDDADVGPYSEGGTVLRNSAATLPSPGTSALRVYGPYSWMVYTGENFSGRSLVVTEGFWKYSSLGHIGNDAIRSIKKIETCSETPIGNQNFYLMPNSAFSNWQVLENRADPYRARLNAGSIDDIYSHGALEAGKHIPGGWVHYHNLCCDYGLQLDLGDLYRIAAIGTQGTCHCDGTSLYEAYYVSQFKVSYSADGVDFNYYTAGGGDVSFTGHHWSDYSIEKRHAFNPTFLASSVRVVTKAGYWFGLRFELYGCVVNTLDNQPTVVDTQHGPTALNATAIVDGDRNTCIPLNRGVLTLPRSLYGQWHFNLTVAYSLSRSDCNGYAGVLVMVHAVPALDEGTQGMYRICAVIGEEFTSEEAVLTYDCSCSYGPCERVVVRTQIAGNCALICEVDY